LRVTARPRNDGRRTGGEQVDPTERAVLFVEADRAVLDLVLANVLFVQVKIKRGFQLAGVGAAAWKFALTPAREKLLVDGEQLPPAAQYALRIGLKVRAAGDQVQV